MTLSVSDCISLAATMRLNLLFLGPFPASAEAPPVNNLNGCILYFMKRGTMGSLVLLCIEYVTKWLSGLIFSIKLSRHGRLEGDIDAHCCQSLHLTGV